MEGLLKNHNSLSARVAEILEDAILTGSIRRGERIFEMKVSVMSGVSKSEDTLNKRNYDHSPLLNAVSCFVLQFN